MGFLSGLASAGTFGLYNPESERTSTQSTTKSIDPALNPIRNKILDQGLAFANQPIQQFQGDRVAGFDPNQTAAMGAMGSLGANGLPLAQKGFNILGGIGTADQRMGAYQNPYTDQVIDRSMQDIERQRQQALSKTAGQAIGAKAFGGARQAVADSLTNEAYARQFGDAAANLRYQGFNTALGAAQQDVTQQQSLGQALSQAGYGAIEGQMNAGQQQQAMQQMLIDSAREKFDEPRNQQMQNMNFLSGLISGVPQGGTQTETGVAAPNTAANFFSNLNQFSGAMKNMGGFSGMGG